MRVRLTRCVRFQGRIQLYSAGAGGASVAAATPVFKFVKPEELVKCVLRRGPRGVARCLPQPLSLPDTSPRRFKGLSHDEMLVFQLIQQSGNMGAL